LKLNISSLHEQQIESEGEIEDDDSVNIYSKEQNPILFENDEQMSDDEQVSITIMLLAVSKILILSRDETGTEDRSV
jgi:hypothetical protein